jgi:hypothetical protein
VLLLALGLATAVPAQPRVDVFDKRYFSRFSGLRMRNPLVA